jgi:hypothetical protein
MSTIKADNYEATTAGNNLIFKANGTEKMRVSPNVGGITNITGVGVGLGGNAINLNTNGTTVHIHEPTAGGASMLHCTNAAQGIGAAKGFICGMWSDNNAYCYTYDPVSLYFGTNRAIQMTVTSAGDVGIGNQAPPCKLYVQGEARSSTSTTSASNANTLTTKDFVTTNNRIGGTTFMVVYAPGHATASKVSFCPLKDNAGTGNKFSIVRTSSYWGIKCADSGEVWQGCVTNWSAGDSWYQTNISSSSAASTPHDGPDSMGTTGAYSNYYWTILLTRIS